MPVESVRVTPLGVEVYVISATRVIRLPDLNVAPAEPTNDEAIVTAFDETELTVPRSPSSPPAVAFDRYIVSPELKLLVSATAIESEDGDGVKSEVVMLSNPSGVVRNVIMSTVDEAKTACGAVPRPVPPGRKLVCPSGIPAPVTRSS